MQPRSGALCIILESPLGTVFVKSPASGDGSETERAYRRLEACSLWSEERGVPPIAPRPIAMGHQPEFICYEWVEGETLTGTFASVGSGERQSDLGQVSYASGRALAQLHSALDRHEDLPPRSAVSLADIGPWNLVRGPDGTLRWIDLGASQRVIPIADDVGRLCHRLYRGFLLRSGERSVRALLAEPGRVLLDLRAGYASQRVAPSVRRVAWSASRNALALARSQRANAQRSRSTDILIALRYLGMAITGR